MIISQVRAFAHEQPKELKRFVKFATVGALGSVTDFAVFNGLVFWASLMPLVANAISFCAAVIQNFLLNRRWTFPESQERTPGKQLSKFAIVSAVGLGINTVVFHYVSTLLEPFWQTMVFDTDWAMVISLNFAKLFAIGVVLFWNFTANRFWTYRGL
ncbi:MAG: GtrA family protein [Chloroflexota bacterium]